MAKNGSKKQSKGKSDYQVKFGILRLFTATLSHWKSNFNSYTKIILVLAVPSTIINILQTQGLIGEYGLVMAIAWSFAIVAIINLAGNRENLTSTRLSTIFTVSSSRILQYVGVSLILLVFVLLLLVGIISLLFAGPVFGVSPVVFVSIGVLGLVLGLVFLSHYCLAQTVTVVDSRSIWDSLKDSARATRGNRIRIIASYSLLILLILTLLSIVQFILSLNEPVNQNTLLAGVIYILEAVVIVPIFFIFQVKLYEVLGEKA